MLGYMTKKEALTIGFTHHGSYYGIPIWISDDYIPMVAAKWAPMEYLMTFFHIMEGLMHSYFHPEDEPGFEFYFGKPIK
jgi:hypothetical protein